MTSPLLKLWSRSLDMSIQLQDMTQHAIARLTHP
jgi:hypothetical protein